MSTTQSVHIEHRKPQAGPLVIDNVPPLAADGMNCTLRDGSRARIICHEVPGIMPVAAIVREMSDIMRRFPDGRRHPDAEVWGDIIALDGQPTEPELVRVDCLERMSAFLHDGLWATVTVCSTRPQDSVECHPLDGGRRFWLRPNVMVRPLAPGESLVITVMADESDYRRRLKQMEE